MIILLKCNSSSVALKQYLILTENSALCILHSLLVIQIQFAETHLADQICSHEQTKSPITQRD